MNRLACPESKINYVGLKYHMTSHYSPRSKLNPSGGRCKLKGSLVDYFTIITEVSVYPFIDSCLQILSRQTFGNLIFVYMPQIS